MTDQQHPLTDTFAAFSARLRQKSHDTQSLSSEEIEKIQGDMIDTLGILTTGLAAIVDIIKIPEVIEKSSPEVYGDLNQFVEFITGLTGLSSETLTEVLQTLSQRIVDKDN